jgi:sodium-dependent dicarboxylate transporter 2/3/5
MNKDGKRNTIAQAFIAHTGRTIQGSLELLRPILDRLDGEKKEAQAQTAPEITFEPLRVLQPKVVGGVQRAFGIFGRFGIVAFLTTIVLLLPTPEGLSPAGHRALAVFVFTGSILALEPVSLPIAALMIPVAQVVLRTATAPQAFETFSRPVVFLILSSLFLAEALRKHGLTRRLALGTIVASGGGANMLLMGLMGIAALLSMWVENTATAAVLIPVALTISKQVPDPKKARGLLVLLVFGIAYGASIGGMATVMGSASNAVASGFLSQIRPWAFMDWMKYGLPAFLLVLPLTWWLLSRRASKINMRWSAISGGELHIIATEESLRVEHDAAMMEVRWHALGPMIKLRDDWLLMMWTGQSCVPLPLGHVPEDALVFIEAQVVAHGAD